MTRLRWLLLAICSIFTLSGCGQSGLYGATLITDGTHTFRATETVHGVLLVAGGHTRIENGTRITGDVYVIDGDLRVSGAVSGDITIIGGRLTLGPTATVSGRLRVGGGVVDQHPAATIRGGVETGTSVAVPTDPGPPTGSLRPGRLATRSGTRAGGVGSAGNTLPSSPRRPLG